MFTNPTRWVAAPLAVLLLAACGGGKARGPSRETLHPLLQKEAEALKADGEKVNPALGVKSTWHIDKLDLTPQPADPDQPWKGAVHFRIEDRTRDVDGSEVVDKREKTFEFVWNTTLERWIFQYTPPASGAAAGAGAQPQPGPRPRRASPRPR